MVTVVASEVEEVASEVETVAVMVVIVEAMLVDIRWEEGIMTRFYPCAMTAEIFDSFEQRVHLAFLSKLNVNIL